MAEPAATLASSLFPVSDAGAEAQHSTGILPSQAIKELMRNREIYSLSDDIAADQIQPASLDLRLGDMAYRVRASFLPGAGQPVMRRIEELGMHKVALKEGAVLERGCVYIVPLLEHVRLNSRLAASANPKSSTGRLDIFTRLITDGGLAFDRVERGYEGPLYIEIAPRTFSVVVRRGSRLNQLRLRRGSPASSEAALRRLHEQTPLVDAAPGLELIRDDSIGVTLDLRGSGADGLVGFRAKKHAEPIDIDKIGHYDARDFWEPLAREPRRGLVLDPDDFYILATKEAVRVPPDHAAEMLAYDTMVGEFRVHYAGFFDPGFGCEEGSGGSKAVLEVRSHEVPFMLEHGQIVGWLRYERLTGIPDRLYGAAIGSSYQSQGLTLGKHFKPWR